MTYLKFLRRCKRKKALHQLRHNATFYFVNFKKPSFSESGIELHKGHLNIKDLFISADKYSIDFNKYNYKYGNNF